jgi:uncharacterized protein
MCRGLARDAATSRTTIDGYLGILEDTLVATRLPAYEARLRVRERAHPKLYWVDPGLVRAARRHLDAVTPDEKGPLLEGWVFTLLRAHNQGASVFDEASYWAPAQARFTEVDFLLRRGRDFLALEVKSSSRFDRSMLTGLQAIGALPRVRRRVLLYLGSQRLETDDGIEVWPVQVFLHHLAQKKFWPA